MKSLVLAALLALAVQSPISAADATRTTAGVPNISGVWRAGMLGGGGPRAGGPRAGGPAPDVGAPALTPPGVFAPVPGGMPAGAPRPGNLVGGGRIAPTIKPEFLARIPQGTMAPNQGVLRNDDVSMLCVPDGYFGSGGGYPNLIIQTAQQVTVVNEENHRIRRIHLGAQHPVKVQSSYAGHSIGHWEGNTLVAHTVGLRERDGLRNPPGYHIVERYTPSADGQQLTYRVEFHSDAYSAPGANSTTWRRTPELRLQEQICEEASENFDAEYYR